MPAHLLKHKSQRVVGIDYGMKRIGIALSDERQIIASPLQVFEAEKKTDLTVIKLLQFVAELEVNNTCTIEEIIVGLPLMMSGKTGLLADEVKHFAYLLSQSTSIPIKLWDERLSTVQAERALRESEMTRKKRSKIVDRVSAAIILQSYLDRKSLLRDEAKTQPVPE